MGHKHSHLSPEALNDMATMSRFTHQEILGFYNDFCKLFPKKRVTKGDLTKIFKKTYPNGDPNELVDGMFRVYDIDSSGTIDFREFLCGLCMMAHGPKDEKLKLAFDMYDADTNGWISKQELIALIRAIFKATSASPVDATVAAHAGEVMFKRLDQNENNRISLQEFINGCKQDPSIIGMIDTFDIPKP